MVSWASTLPLVVTRLAVQLRSGPPGSCSLSGIALHPLSLGVVAASIWTSPRWNWWFSPGLWFPLPVTSAEQPLRWQPSVKCGDEAERESGVRTLSAKDELFSAAWRASTLTGSEISEALLVAEESGGVRLTFVSYHEEPD